MEQVKSYPVADHAARNFMVTSIFFLVLASLVGLVAGMQLMGLEWTYALNFAHIRPLHVGLIAFGWLSMFLMGAIFYIVPREVENDLHSPLMAKLQLVLLIVGIPIIGVSYLLGYSDGRPYADPILILDLVVVIIWLLFFVNLLLTIIKGKLEDTSFLSKGALIFTMVSVLYLGINYLISMIPISGIRDTIIIWTWAHNAVNGWFMLGLVGCLLYALPKLTGLELKNLFSEKLFYFLFWPMMLFIPNSAFHHLLYDAVPVNLTWKVIGELTSIGMIVPTSILIYIIYIFYKNSKADMGLPGKFILVTIILYSVTCLQGAFQSVRFINSYLHGTQWVTGHAHLALGGWISFGFYGMAYYLLPKVTGKKLHSQTLGNTHFWLGLVGMLGMIFAMSLAGLVEAGLYYAGSSFYSADQATSIHSLARAIFGVCFLLSTIVFAYNTYKTVTAKTEIDKPDIKRTTPLNV